MAYTDLRQYVAKLSSAGQLLEIDAEVDPAWEVGTICHKVLGESGPAILFHSVKGYPYPVLANMLATMDRCALAMEVPADDLVESYIRKTASHSGPDLPVVPRAEAPCKEVTLDLAGLAFEGLVPPIVSNPGDGGAYLNFGLIVTKDPETGLQNMGIYRLQLRDNLVTGFWCSPTSHAGMIRGKHEARGQDMEVAICVGADPVLYLASQVAGMNLGADELKLAANMRGEPFNLVRADTVDLLIPANCEFVFEGRVLTGRREPEGPYGEYPGYYGPVGEQPVLQIQHATRRAEPIFAYTYLGMPPTDTHAMGQLSMEAGYLHKLRTDVAPTVRAIYCPQDMHTVIVSLKKTYEEQAKHVIYSLWSARIVKTVIVVDDDVDPHNLEQVSWAIANRCHASRDVVVADGFCTIGPSPQKYGSDGIANKIGIDATEPLKGFPALVRPTSDMMDRVNRRWGELTAPRTSRLRARR
jgi:UbiD family decarboxylase